MTSKNLDLLIYFTTKYKWLVERKYMRTLSPPTPFIDLCQSAFAGFPEAAVQVDAGFVHGPANHVVADIPGAGEEVAQVAGVHGPHGGHGVALDAGNLHQPADGVAGQPQVMLHGYLGGVFHLV